MIGGGDMLRYVIVTDLYIVVFRSELVIDHYINYCKLLTFYILSFQCQSNYFYMIALWIFYDINLVTEEFVLDFFDELKVRSKVNADHSLKIFWRRWNILRTSENDQFLSYFQSTSTIRSQIVKVLGFYIAIKA